MMSSAGAVAEHCTVNRRSQIMSMTRSLTYIKLVSRQGNNESCGRLRLKVYGRAQKFVSGKIVFASFHLLVHIEVGGGIAPSRIILFIGCCYVRC